MFDYGKRRQNRDLLLIKRGYITAYSWQQIPARRASPASPSEMDIYKTAAIAPRVIKQARQNL